VRFQVLTSASMKLTVPEDGHLQYICKLYFSYDSLKVCDND
jgi:hypothetical protein